MNNWKYVKVKIWRQLLYKSEVEVEVIVVVWVAQVVLAAAAAETDYIIRTPTNDKKMF